jgi:hypothetical protein
MNDNIEFLLGQFRRLDQLDALGLDDSEEAEQIRGTCDAPWRDMSESEHRRFLDELARRRMMG